MSINWSDRDEVINHACNMQNIDDFEDCSDVDKDCGQCAGCGRDCGPEEKEGNFWVCTSCDNMSEHSLINREI